MATNPFRNTYLRKTFDFMMKAFQDDDGDVLNAYGSNSLAKRFWDGYEGVSCNDRMNSLGYPVRKDSLGYAAYCAGQAAKASVVSREKANSPE